MTTQESYRVVLSPKGEDLFEEWTLRVRREDSHFSMVVGVVGALYGLGRSVSMREFLRECEECGMGFPWDHSFSRGLAGLVGVYPSDEFCPPCFVYDGFKWLVERADSYKDNAYRLWTRKGRILDILREGELA